MPFRNYDALRIFTIVARHDSFSAAADALNRTKGAVSYQINQLEDELGFALFQRLPRGIALTERGTDLLASAETAYHTIEQKIQTLKAPTPGILTIGVTTYFASRWLSSRLMTFMTTHPDIRLRVQPMVDLMALSGEGVDLTIRWGDGRWDDLEIETLFLCPAFPTGNAAAKAAIEQHGLEAGLARLTLLRDRDDSNAWSEWYAAAGLGFQTRTDTLIIPDPNVRVQAVMDGQGIALNDALVADEIASGQLHRLSDTALDHYGYHLAYEADALDNPDAAAFVDWLRAEA